MAETEDLDAPDPLDALLREVAHVSAPRAGARGLRAGASLVGGRFSVLRKLGEGGMGKVYEAFDAQRQGRVALKALRHLDAAAVYRLKNEFRALADVTHPSLVQLYELFADEDAWFFTMELIDGERFDHWVRPGGALSETRLRSALAPLIAGVEAIHAAGKLHRDLKPSNVLVTHEGRVVVLDFGLSVDPELGGVGQTVTDQSVSGTPAYMAPEQAAGKTASTASDHYAIGVMLFEALTGRLPFEGKSHEMLTDKQRREAPRAAQFARCPSDLDVLCTQLLSLDPALRPSALDLREHLLLPASHTTLARSRAAASTASFALDSPVELLGRDEELLALREAFAETVAGKPVIVFVSGESGLGKSALCETFLHELRAQGAGVVLSGRCYERENVPFKGFDALVDDVSRHLRRLAPREAAAVLPREVFALAHVFPALDRVEVVAEAPKKEVLDPHDLKRRAFDAFAELLARLRDRAPLVVFLDDMQWLDLDAMRFMRHLLLHPQPAPALMICAHRSEGAATNAQLEQVLEVAHDNGKLEVRRLAIGALSEAALGALARRLLPPSMPPAAAAALAREAHGSPFFATEIARAAALSPALDRPPTLERALALHLDALPAGSRRILALLALAGRPLRHDRLAEASGLSQVHALLDRLRSEHLVRASFDAEGTRLLECYHDKIREQLIASLGALETTELALSLSRALLSQGDADSELLARLLVLAGRETDAAQHAARAADVALSSLAFERAAELYAQALRFGVFEPARAQALRVSRADALARAGHGTSAAEVYLEAARSAESAEAARALRANAGGAYLKCGEIERGRALFIRELRTAGLRLPTSRPASLAWTVWSRFRLWLRGLSFTRRSEFDPNVVRELETLEAATHTLIRVDHFRAAGVCAHYARRALDLGHAPHAARGLAWEIVIRTLSSSAAQTDAAQALCEQLCVETGDVTANAWLHFSRGIRRCLQGRFQEMLEDEERGLAFLAQGQLPWAGLDRAWFQYLRCTALLALGRVGDATSLSLAQVSEALARGDRNVGAALVYTVTIGLLALDRSEQAERLVDQVRTDAKAETTQQHQFYLQARSLIAAYRGEPHEFWQTERELISRYLASPQARMAGMASAFLGSSAAAAARTAPDPAERARLRATAKRLTRRYSRSAHAWVVSTSLTGSCLEGDRAGAAAALRAALARVSSRFMVSVFERRLGEVLGGDDGAALVVGADAALLSFGVVQPARFVTAVLPGVELPGPAR